MTTVPTGAREITLRFLAAPTDAGYSGHVSGGSILEWIDKAGYACVAGWSGRYCVTAYAGDVRYATPVQVGHLVQVEARLLHTEGPAMHIAVHVRSGDPATGELALTTHCLVVFVALDSAGRPVDARTWTPVSAQDLALDEHATELIELRAGVDRPIQTG